MLKIVIGCIFAIKMIIANHFQIKEWKRNDQCFEELRIKENIQTSEPLSKYDMDVSKVANIEKHINLSIKMIGRRFKIKP